jgi:uncharacterized phiE125 gp8 family phage protein
MPRQLLTDVTVEPISLVEAKAHLVVEVSEFDTQISGLISAARKHVEKRTGRAIGRQAWRLFFNYFPAYISAEPWDVISVTQVQYVDAEGATQTVSPSDYTFDVANRVIRPVYGVTWPAARGDLNCVWADVWSGYAVQSGSPLAWVSACPADLKAALLLLIGHLWKNRESAADLELYTNRTFEHLIDPYWIPTA